MMGRVGTRCSNVESMDIIITYFKIYFKWNLLCAIEMSTNISTRCTSLKDTTRTILHTIQACSLL